MFNSDLPIHVFSLIKPLIHIITFKDTMLSQILMSDKQLSCESVWNRMFPRDGVLSRNLLDSI